MISGEVIFPLQMTFNIQYTLLILEENLDSVHQIIKISFLRNECSILITDIGKF